MKKQPQRFEFSIEFEGKNYDASYTISSKVITVNSAYGGPSSTQLGSLRANVLAEMLLREILNGAKSRGVIK